MIEGGNRQIVEYFMNKSGVSFVDIHAPPTLVNIQGPEFDFKACYKSMVIAGYWKEILHMVSYICDKFR